MAERCRARYSDTMLFPPFEPDRNEPRRRRFRPIPVRTLVPNILTLLAMCAGLTAIRLAVEGKVEFALAAIIFAAIIDALDGRVARLLKGTSRFGAELDSLADFVSFGAAPAVVLYIWGLGDLKSVGWIAALIFAMCTSLRLARFNVAIDDPDRPAWEANFFTGVPAPAGALLVLLPVYLSFVPLPSLQFPVILTFFYTLFIAFLMVSRLPVFSGKKAGARVPREMVVPVLFISVLFFALLLSFPWEVMSLGTLVFLACLPLGWLAHRRLARKAAAKTLMADDQDPAQAPPQVGTSDVADNVRRLN